MFRLISERRQKCLRNKSLEINFWAASHCSPWISLPSTLISLIPGCHKEGHPNPENSRIPHQKIVPKRNSHREDADPNRSAEAESRELRCSVLHIAHTRVRILRNDTAAGTEFFFLGRGFWPGLFPLSLAGVKGLQLVGGNDIGDFFVFFLMNGVNLLLLLLRSGFGIPANRCDFHSPLIFNLPALIHQV